jgi:hypothetical protein
MEKSIGRKLEHERRMGNLPRIPFARRIKPINHSQLADDALFLGATSTIIARRFKKILQFSQCFRRKNKLQ